MKWTTFYRDGAGFARGWYLCFKGGEIVGPFSTHTASLAHLEIPAGAMPVFTADRCSWEGCEWCDPHEAYERHSY